MRNTSGVGGFSSVNFLVGCAALVAISSVSAQGPTESPVHHLESVKVNVDNYVRAETASQFDRILKLTGGLNQWHHNRAPTPLDQQNVIRMNRDTLYSSSVVDISKGATLTIPDAGDRYLSVMVVNEDEYINKVFHEPGEHRLTVEEFDTPYVSMWARTLVDSSDPKDIREANALQDKIIIKSNSAVAYTHPNYDQESYQVTFNALAELSNGVPDTKGMFGSQKQVSEVRHMLGAACCWGGLPVQEAFYLPRNKPLKARNHQLTVKDVPVDGFWSITIYNKEGFLEENEFDSYSINSITATPDEDGSITVNFATSPDGKKNFLYITDGWNYTIRMYRPGVEILNGTWVFPDPKPVD